MISQTLEHQQVFSGLCLSQRSLSLASLFFSPRQILGCNRGPGALTPLLLISGVHDDLVYCLGWSCNFVQTCQNLLKKMGTQHSLASTDLTSRYLAWGSQDQQTWGAFLWDDPDHGRSSERWIHSGQGFFGSFDLPWSEWSRVTDPDADHAKGTHPWSSYKSPSWLGAQACLCEYYNEQPNDQRGNENCVELTPAVSQLNYIYTHISW